MRPVLFAIGGLAALLLAVAYLLRHDLRSMQDVLDRSLEPEITEPVEIESKNQITMQPHCIQKVVEINGKPMTVSWYCPPMNPGETQEEYGARCRRELEEWCAGFEKEPVR